MKLIGKAIKVGNFFLAWDKEENKYLPHQTEIHIFVLGDDKYLNNIEAILRETKTKRKNDECSIIDIYHS